MKLPLSSAVSIIALSASVAARADTILNVQFGGTVDDGTYTDSGPVNTSFVAGQAITGSFQFDENTNQFVAFQIGGYSVQPGYTSIYSPPLASTAPVPGRRLHEACRVRSRSINTRLRSTPQRYPPRPPSLRKTR